MYLACKETVVGKELAGFSVFSSMRTHLQNTMFKSIEGNMNYNTTIVVLLVATLEGYCFKNLRAQSLFFRYFRLYFHDSHSSFKLRLSFGALITVLKTRI